MICDALREKLSLYVGDDLPAAETRAVAEHLAGCADCRLEEARWRESLGLLRQVAAGARYPKAKLPRERWTRHPVWKAATAAAVVAALLVGTQVPAVVAVGGGVVGWVKSFTHLSVLETSQDEAARLQKPIQLDENDPGAARAMPLADIEAQIDYSLLKPTYLPEGFTFKRSLIVPLFQDVLLEYQGPAGLMTIQQSIPDSPRWQVTAPAVEYIPVGDGTGALSRRAAPGGKPGNPSVWEHTVLSLWIEREDGRVVSVEWDEGDYPVAEVIKVAESLQAPPEPVAEEPLEPCEATRPARNTAGGGRFVAKPLAEIEARIGWNVTMPTYLPEGTNLIDSQVQPSLYDHVLLNYVGPKGSFIIVQSALNGQAAPEPESPLCAREQIRVGDKDAVLSRGGWDIQPDGTGKWRSGGGHWMQFVQGDKLVVISSWNGHDGLLSVEEMIRVAESIR